MQRNKEDEKEEEIQKKEKIMQLIKGNQISI